MNVNTCQNLAQTKAGGCDVKIMQAEGQNGMSENNSFQKLLSFNLSQATAAGANGSGTATTETATLKNPLFQLLQSFAGDGDETAGIEEQNTMENTGDSENELLAALQGNLAGVLGNNPRMELNKSNGEEDQNSVQNENPGKQKLVEKLQESSQNMVYSSAVWMAQPVQNIMKEIKINRETTQISVVATSNTDAAEAAESAGQATTASTKQKNGTFPATADAKNAQAISLEGFEAVSELEANEYAKAFKDNLLKNNKEQSVNETGQQTQNGQQAIATANPASGISNVPAESAKLEAYSQISTEILSKLEQKGPMEFKMQLQPENLGNIDVQLKVSEGKLIIDITAASAKTQSLLVSQVDRLISNLGLQNVQVENVQIGQTSQINQPIPATHTGQGVSEQLYAMSGGMDFSHRGNQNQLSGQNKNFGQDNRRDDQIQGAKTVEGSRTIRNSTQKMDYAI